MSKVWFCEVEGCRIGPVSLDTLRSLVRDGILKPNDPVWRGEEFPQPASEVSALRPSEHSPVDEPPIAAPPLPEAAPPIPCVVGVGFDLNHKPLQARPAELFADLTTGAFLIRDTSGQTLTISLRDLHVQWHSPEKGMLLVQKSAFRLAKSRSVRISAEHLAPILPLLPPSHPVREITCQLLEGRDFLATLKARKPLTPVVWTIAALCVLTFFAQSNVEDGASRGLLRFTIGTYDLLRQGGDFRPAVLAGEWYRLVVSGFLHAGVMHLLMNMLGLLEIGPFCERLIGSRAFLLIYVTSLLASSWLSISFHEMPVVSVGASGAIFGVIGIMIAASRKGLLPQVLRRRMFGTAFACLLYQGFFELVGVLLGGSGLDQIAHLAGLAIGWGAAWGILRWSSGPPIEAPVRRTALFCGGLLAIAFLLGFAGMPKGAWEPMSCIDRGRLEMSSRETRLLEMLETGTDVRARSRNLLSIMQESSNPYVLFMATSSIVELDANDGWRPSLDPLTMARVLEVTSGCPESHAAWLWIRAQLEIRRQDVEAVRATALEIVSTISRGHMDRNSAPMITSIILTLPLLDFDTRLMDPVVRAWDIMQEHPATSAIGDEFLLRVSATIALEMVGRHEAARTAMPDVLLENPSIEFSFPVALLLYLRGDVTNGRRLLQESLAFGLQPDSWKEVGAEVLELPDADAVERVRRGVTMPGLASTD